MIDLFDKIMAQSHLQIFCNGFNTLRLEFFLVWMACARKGSVTYLNTPQVRRIEQRGKILPEWPNSLLAAERQAYFRTFVIASVAGIFSLFPLLFTPTGSFLFTRTRCSLH